jgi:hypothetical protein
MPQVYQRQLMKSDLAAATIEVGQGSNQLSHYELKRLFHLEDGDGASTQQLVPGKGAAARGSEAQAASSSSSAGPSDSSSSGSSSHISWLDLSRPGELPKALAAAVAAGGISAINQEDHAGTTPAAVAAVPGSEGPGAEAAGGADDGGGASVSDEIRGSGADPDYMCLEVE